MRLFRGLLLSVMLLMGETVGSAANFVRLGSNPLAANAVRWQVWTALLVYVLLRYQAFLSNWGSSFVRLWTCVRAALWLKRDAVALLKSYGTAGGDFRLLGQPQAAYLPGFRPGAVG